MPHFIAIFEQQMTRMRGSLAFIKLAWEVKNKPATMLAYFKSAQML